MTFATISLLAFAVSTCQAAHAVQQFATEPSVQAVTTIPPAQHYAPLTGKTAARASKQTYKKELVQHLSGTPFTGHLAGASMDQEYFTQITIGGQNFNVIVDTGSSDTWVPGKGFQCTNGISQPEPQYACNFGPGQYDPAMSKTFKSFPYQTLNTSYGDGEFVSGPVGFETISVAGLTVTHQQFSYLDKAAWNGDAVTAGLFGLAYPDLTAVYNESTPYRPSPYNPFFFTAVKEKKVNPYFSIALNRGSLGAEEHSNVDANRGYIAFGGLPPTSVTNTKATVKVQQYTVYKREYLYWTVPVDKYVFPGSAKLATNGTAILDTGTTLNYLPKPIAAAVNKQFKPPATYSEEEGVYMVACNATAPAFSVVLGGVAFSVDGKDLIVPAGTDADGNEVCVSGTQDGGPYSPNDLFILGDVFLHNVVATFQTSANAITVTERTKY